MRHPIPLSPSSAREASPSSARAAHSNLRAPIGDASAPSTLDAPDERPSQIRPIVREERPTSTLAQDAAAAQMVRALVARGVTTYFGVPGGPICPVFEALRITPGVTLVESRHESHAAFAAVAYHRATGEVPAIVITAGPGITNVVSGVASAALEGTPMLVIAGDVAWSSHGGCLLQDSGPQGIHAEQLLGPITRGHARVRQPQSAVSQAISMLDVATDPSASGPALLIVPIDLGMATAAPGPVVEASRRLDLRAPRSAVEKTARWLAEAERPLLVLGAGARASADEVRALVDILDIPFVTTPRAKGLVSEHHPRSLRTGGMAASNWAREYTKRGVDVALVLGTDLDDVSVGPTPYITARGRLIHIDRDARVFHRNLPTAMAVSADVGHFVRDLYDEVSFRGLRHGRIRDEIRTLRATSPFDVEHPGLDDAPKLAPHRAIIDLELATPERTRFVTDIGEHMLFALHYVTASGPDRFHIQLNLGGMGSGIAGAIGLGVADPETPIACICGDGGMQMSGMELLVAKERGLPIVYAVFNDGRYNMVHHGMKQIFGAGQAWDAPPVDFAAWASSMGIASAIIERPGQVDARLLASLGLGRGPIVLDMRIDADRRIRAGGRVEALQHMSMLAEAARKGGAQ